MQKKIKLPKRSRGYQSPAEALKYQQNLEQFAEDILEINTTLDFTLSLRGWCYLLEEYGLQKGDFDKAGALFVKCRKSGLLPINIWPCEA